MDAPHPDLTHPAVVARAALPGLLAPRRAAGARVVFTNGCYDILHPGHVDLLARARAEGDLLVLGLNSDASVRRQGKGADRPVNPFAVRAYVLAHLASVDYVVEFDEDTPHALITEIQPDVLVKGGDWSVDRIVGRDIVQARGGRVLSLPLLPGFSTTGLIQRIRSGLSACAAGE
jgi:rfaE bifunctional protein nucleotidyltransferase chain/domain